VIDWFDLAARCALFLVCYVAARAVLGFILGGLKE
jgi:hypothetical protein